MYNALLFIKEQLTDNPIITDEIPASNIYPVIAAAEVAGDFITYTVGRNTKFTKDGLISYDCDVTIYGDDILEAAQKADIIQTELTNNKSIYGLSASVDYTEDYQRAYIKINLTLKI